MHEENDSRPRPPRTLPFKIFAAMICDAPPPVSEGIRVSRLVISKVLNHVENGITAVYDRHSYDREKREALDQWDRLLTSILQSGKLIPFEPATA